MRQRWSQGVSDRCRRLIQWQRWLCAACEILRARTGWRAPL